MPKAPFSSKPGGKATLFIGNKSIDLPVELPVAPELTLNLKTAAALGIAIPRELRVQAHAVVE